MPSLRDRVLEKATELELLSAEMPSRGQIRALALAVMDMARLETIEECALICDRAADRSSTIGRLASITSYGEGGLDRAAALAETLRALKSPVKE